MKRRRVTNLKKALHMYNKIETPETYHILERFDLDMDYRNEEDKLNHNDDLNVVIDNATKIVQKDGSDKYIVKVLKKIEAVKQPYDVVVKDLETK